MVLLREVTTNPVGYLGHNSNNNNVIITQGNSKAYSLDRGRRYNRIKQKQGGQIPGSRNGQNVQTLTSEVLATQYGVDEKTILAAF